MDASTVKTVFEDMEKAWKEEEKHFEVEIAKSNALPEGVVVGKLVNTPVADGYAWYEVVKVGKKTVKLKWRPDLCPDKWRDAVLGEGGSFPLQSIARIVNFREGMRKLFSQKKKD